MRSSICSAPLTIYRSSCRIDQSKDTNTFSSSDTSSDTQILPFPLWLRNLILCIVAPCPAPHPLLHRLHWGFELGNAGMPSLARPPHRTSSFTLPLPTSLCDPAPGVASTPQPIQSHQLPTGLVHSGGVLKDSRPLMPFNHKALQPRKAQR